MLKKKIEKLRQALSNKHLIDEVEIPTTKKERLEANKRAEQLVKDIEEGKLEVTDEIKKELLKFTGYGGLGGLDNDEYYTPKGIAKGAWKALELPKGSKVLDPSTGIGIFSATAPNGINIIGCDLNPISGKIANIVNDNSKIEAGISFEEYSKQLEPNSIDAIITNVPFGNRDTQLQSIDMPNITRNEDYFILKSLQLLKGGKRAVFLTTSSTAQRTNRQDSRIEMFKLASFIGGTRLPSEMFKDTGTEQVVDVLVFEKHPDIALDSDIVPDEVNQDFIDGVYFDKRPDRVLGTFKSREQAIQEAEKAGVKLHHQAQKDVVTLPPNTTIEDIKANFNLPNFKNGIDYSAVVHIEKSKQDVKKDNLKDWLLDYAEKLEAGKIAKLVNYKKFVKKYNKAINLGIQFSERNNILLYARLVADTQFKIKLFFKEITKEDILENKKEIKKWLKSTPKTHPYNSLVVEKWNYLSKFDLETGEFITDITALIGMEDEGVFKDKESITTNYQKAYSLDSFTKDELMQDDVFIDNNLAFKREDWLVYNRGKSFKDFFTIKPDNLTDDEWQIKRDNMLEQLEEDYSTNTDISKFKVPLSLIPEIFSPKLVSRLEHMAKGLNSVKKQCRDNSIQALNGINDDNEGKNLYDKIITNYAYVKYIEHLFYDKSLYLFDRKINMEEDLLERCKFVVKEEYYKTAEVITTVIDNYIHNNPTYASVLQKWLEDKKTIDYDFQGSYDICNELNGYIKNTMLSRARHYQNADSRKFAKEMDGICAYSTGLGKTMFSLMTASQMLVRGSAKRVAYVVPNAIFSKIVNEAKNTLTEKMLKKTLFIDNKNKADINRLKTDKTIQFIIFSAPTVTSQFKLHQENLDLLWGANSKEENTNEDKQYPPNKLRNWVKRYPTYSKNAKYYWEDTGIDAIIIDEAHHHKNAVASATAGVKGLNPTTTNESVVLLTFVEYIKGLKRRDMKGCILTTATPATSSPTELETMLVFSTDRKALESKAIYDSKAFEKRFFTIVKKNVLKTDGLNYAERKVLTGLTNLEQMREAGLNKVLYRTAEQEEAVARERGQTIVVKPYSEEYQAEIDTDIKDDYDKLTQLNAQFSNDIRQFNKGMLNITEDNAMYMVLAKEYGEIFGYINRVNKLAINNAFAYGYTKIKLDKPMSKDEIFNLIGDIKIPYKIAEVKKEKYGSNTLIIKNAEIELKNYYNTEYYLKQVELDIPTYNIVEDDYLYLPSIDYTVIKKVLSKVKGSFVKEDYPKLSGVVDNIINELKRKPKAKQIIYATTLATHHILEHLIKSNVKAVKKIWHFNGTALKNADARLKVQEDFNNFNDVGIMIFGRAGEVGVDFNKNVSAVHLLDIGQTPDAREQAKGRAVRQGNTMDKVNVYNYFANGTFDKFLMDLTVGKSNWINAVANKNIQSTDYSDDSIETISNEAQRKYGHLNIPLEEKIQKYLKDVQKEKEQFRKATNNAIIDAELKDLESFKNTYEDRTNYTMYSYLSTNNYRTYFNKDQLKGISLKYYSDASYNELESILECKNFYPYGGALLADMKEADKQQYEELKVKAIEQLKDIDEEILEWYNTKADDKRKKYFDKLVKDPEHPFTSVYAEKLDLLYSNYEFVYNQWANKDEIINNKLKGLYDKIDTNVSFEIFKDNIDLVTIENGVYKLPDLTEIEFYYKSGYYSFDPYLIGYKGVVAKIKDKEIQEYSKIDYSTWRKYTTVERFVKDTKKEIDIINEAIKNIDEGNYTLVTDEVKIVETPIYIIDNGGYVAFAYKDYEKLLYTRSGKIEDSKYPIKKHNADTYKTLEELANSDVTAKERIIEWIEKHQ